ncbi:hypothetical protein [Mesorhizobium sp. M7A.F.Ca.MR.362.00.0.0]|uniref:hypothetical protein n=1 Tax=Mesorhizobium sp. M7A.F.Ca.MR.362.00.0.0 TaxID=2496779 RepID=UPI000FD46BCE|nr:hypothetical protein [Mesorhizobium sp. M7A.F.Ca.MR.362.00.0.0]RUU79736.1 hypothetical protein EOC06_14870 [Mesorhizobium sp. M7A.F.Ca.MR.362.00.0.0]RWN95495.1 MAG: hypothetical protein EOS05_11925 [Mesorhizobium sp.]
MNENLKPTIAELLNLKAQLDPLEAKFEAAKEVIRAAGADSYDVPGVGKVIVSAPVLRTAKGTAIVIDPEKLEQASAKLKAQLFTLGILKTETIYTRASKSKVEVKLVEEVRKAA